MSLRIYALTANDIPLMNALLTTFGEAFDDAETYNAAKRPSEEYLRQLLNGDTFIALAALKRSEVVGGIAAYELRKFEQERSEIYIYDLAVATAHRREGIATALIEKLKDIAAGAKPAGPYSDGTMPTPGQPRAKKKRKPSYRMPAGWMPRS